MRQGAVGEVRLVDREGRRLVEKRLRDPARHDTELRALRALEGSGLPVPQVIDAHPGMIVMTELPGTRLDDVDPESRLAGLRDSASLLRRLHSLETPTGLPPAPDDAEIVARYRAADGPHLPLSIPPSTGRVFCHGDWGDGNLLGIDGRVTGVVDWEAAHVGDPIREVARAAYGAARKDPRSAQALIEGYGADASAVAAWYPIHAAALWLWFRQAGPAEYLAQLTAELQAW